MRRLILFCLISLIWLSGILSQPVTSVAAKDTWIKVKTSNFTLIGNASEKEIRRVGAKLEQFHASVSRLFDWRRRRFAPPVTVVLFKDQASYQPFKPLYQGQPAEVSGYLQSSRDAAYITLTADGREANSDRVIFHEYIHFLTGGSRPLPTWLSEGLAEYYSTFAVTGRGKQVIVGGRVPAHAQLLLEGKLLPLATLLAVTPDSPFYQEPDKKSLFYAQSWALVHYLLTGSDGLRRPAFLQFLAASEMGLLVEKGLKQSFQSDLAEMEADLRQYIRRSVYHSQTTTFEQKIETDTSVQAAPLSDSDTLAYLGDLLWHLERHEEGEAMLMRALEMDGASAIANTSLGLLRVKQKRFAEGRHLLQSVIEAGTANYLVYFSHAFAWQQEHLDWAGYVSGFEPEAAVSMRASLNRARELAPEFADTYRGLAFINLVQKENLDEAVGLLKKALELEPGREDFIYTLAQVYSRQENFIAARRTAESIISGGESASSSPEIRDRAKYLLEMIARRESEVAQARLEEETRRRQQRHSPPSPANSEDDPTRPPGKRFIGEQVRGLLTRVECAEDHITLTVTSGGRAFKFRAEVGKLVFVRHTMEIPNQITCGAMIPQPHVIVTYRPATGIKVKFDGEPIGVEFLKAAAN